MIVAIDDGVKAALVALAVRLAVWGVEALWRNWKGAGMGEVKVEPQEKFVRTKDVADQLGISPRTVSHWRKANRIPAVKYGKGTFRFKMSEVLAALERERQAK